MLVITPQPHLHPGGYFTADPSGSASRPGWAIHTKPRAEKKLARYLGSLGIPHYLPTVQHQHVYGNRAARKSWVPLFPSYLFVLGQTIDKTLLFRSGVIVRLVPAPSPEELHADLRSLWITLSARPGAVTEAPYLPGTPVEVTSGPLQGVRGELVQNRRGARRLAVCIHLFQRAVVVDIDTADTRPL